MNNKSAFANTISDLGDYGNMMSGCERYGMTWGCDEDCPVLQAGECKNYSEQNDDIKELFKELYCYD